MEGVFGATPRSTRPTGRCRGWPPARFCGASSSCSGTCVSSAWRRSPTATSTTCAARRPTAPSAPCGPGRGRPRSTSPCARRPIRRACPATSASTPSTRATADGAKGLFLINLVDPDRLRSAVTQYEFVGAVHGISERFLLPLLEGLLLSFPFRIFGFHADNGSEYINHQVAGLLEKLRVERFTKSRPRNSNDNALVEGKNAHVVRRWFGHDHIPRRFAGNVNRFAHGVLSPFLNFHRPCLFATEYRDAAGRIRRKSSPATSRRPTPGSARCPAPSATSSPASTSNCSTPPPRRRPTSRPRAACRPNAVRCSGASPTAWRPRPDERWPAPAPCSATGGRPPGPRPRREAGFGGRVRARRRWREPAPSPGSAATTADPCPTGYFPEARQGSASPTATPRRRACSHRRAPVRTHCQPRRRARVAIALDPPPPSRAIPAPRFPDAPGTP